MAEVTAASPDLCNYLVSRVANGTLKNVGIRKFWQHLKIVKAFLISLEVSFLHGLFLSLFESRNFLPRSFGPGFLTYISVSQKTEN